MSAGRSISVATRARSAVFGALHSLTAGRVASDLTILYSSQLIAQALAFTVVVLLGRRLGTAGLGILALSQTVVGYLLTIQEAKLSAIGVREVARAPVRASILLTDIVGIRMAAGLLLFLVYAAIIALLPLGSQQRVVFFLAGTLMFGQALSPEWVFQGLGMLKPVAAIRVAYHLILLGLIAWFVRGPGDVASAAAFKALPELVVNGAFLAGAVWVFRLGWIRPDIRRWKALLRQSAPLATAGVFAMIYEGKFDHLILGAVRGSSEVGVYAAVYSIHMALVAALKPMSFAFYPKLASATAMSKRATAEVRQAYIVLAAGGGAILTALTIAAAPPIIHLLFGQDYLPGVRALRILALSPFVTGVGAPFVYTLTALNQGSRIAAVYGGAMITNLILNFAWIPLWGIDGAAAALVASQTVVTVLAYRYLYRLPKETLVVGGSSSADERVQS